MNDNEEERMAEIRRLHERSKERHGAVYEALAKWERENEPVNSTPPASAPDDRSDPSDDRETEQREGVDGMPDG